MINVLVFPGGSEIGLEINNALKYSKAVNVYGGSSVNDHADYVYSRMIHGIPYYSDSNFISELNSIIDQYHIDFIYPALDTVQLFLTEHKKELNATVITSDIKTVQICRSKAETYAFFSNYSFIPLVYSSLDQIEAYPVFVKPSIGCSAIGATRIDSKEDLDIYLSENKDEIVIAEYLPGEEYTIDCFTDCNRKLRIIKPRVRSRVKCGISVHSKEIPLDSQIEYIAETINSKLCFNGAWFFQIKKDIWGNYKLMEISARIPGTMGLSRNCGINFPLLTLYNFMGVDVSLLDNNYDIEVDRAFISRYSLSISYAIIYLDLDDTLILPSGKINTLLMMYLYQSVNEGKKIILLSKHIHDIHHTLCKHKISLELFDEIISISKCASKSDYINEKEAIFIDDSFAERRDVSNKLQIPVFDLDMIESLINWRV